MSRGGNFRKRVPDVDPSQLLVVMENYVKTKGVHKAFVFGSYDNMTRSQAAYGPGLAKNADLLSALLSVAPAGLFKSRVLGEHLMILATNHKLMPCMSPEAVKVLVSRKADCIMTMMCHL